MMIYLLKSRKCAIHIRSIGAVYQHTSELVGGIHKLTILSKNGQQFWEEHYDDVEDLEKEFKALTNMMAQASIPEAYQVDEILARMEQLEKGKKMTLKDYHFVGLETNLEGIPEGQARVVFQEKVSGQQRNIYVPVENEYDDVVEKLNNADDSTSLEDFQASFE